MNCMNVKLSSADPEIPHKQLYISLTLLDTKGGKSTKWCRNFTIEKMLKNSEIHIACDDAFCKREATPEPISRKTRKWAAARRLNDWSTYRRHTHTPVGVYVRTANTAESTATKVIYKQHYRQHSSAWHASLFAFAQHHVSWTSAGCGIKLHTTAFGIVKNNESYKKKRSQTNECSFDQVRMVEWQIKIRYQIISVFEVTLQYVNTDSRFSRSSPLNGRFKYKCSYYG